MAANHALASNDSPNADSDYDTILAALIETARGRSFLQEFARRSRADDTATLLTAIGRIEDLLTSRSLEPSATMLPPTDWPAAADKPRIAEAAAHETIVSTVATFEVAELDIVEILAATEEPETPARAQPAPRDPFADIRTLSDEEKIALFT